MKRDTTIAWNWCNCISTLHDTNFFKPGIFRCVRLP